jgi:hypothetical protein
MSKPYWEDAPSWAQWLAQDAVGTHRDHYWVWFENKPETMSNGWIDHSPDGQWYQTTNVAGVHEWRKTLETRP